MYSKSSFHPPFICWACYHMAWNIPLGILGQLSWLCLLFLLSFFVKKEKALVLCKHVLWQPKRWCVINAVGHKSRLQHHTGCYEASSPARPLRWDSNQTRKVGDFVSLVLCSPVVIPFQQTSLIFPVFWQKSLFSNDLQRNEWSWVCFPSAFAGRTLGLKSYSTPPFFQNLFIPGKVVSYAWIFYIHR